MLCDVLAQETPPLPHCPIPHCPFFLAYLHGYHFLPKKEEEAHGAWSWSDV